MGFTAGQPVAVAKNPIKSSGPDGYKRGKAIAAYKIDWRNPATLEDSVLLDFVLNSYEGGKNRRQDWEADAAEQLAWLRGNQSLMWDEGERDLIEESFESLPLEFKDPVQINKLKGFALAFMGMTMGQPMGWEVYAQTRDDDDIAAARLARSLLNYYWQSGDRQAKARLFDMMWMMWGTGVVFIKPRWDPLAGAVDTFAAHVLDEPGLNEESDRQRDMLARWRDTQDEDVLRVPTGDFYLDYASGFDITEPVNTRSVEEASWLIDSRFQSIEHLRERYPETAQDLEPDQNTEQYQYRSYEQYGNRTDYTGAEPRDEPTNEIIVHKLWRPRSGSAPKGVFVVVAGQTVLYKGAHPYLHGRLPFIGCYEMPEPEHFRPGCTCRDLMSLQRARNKQRSQIHGHLEMTVDPRVLIESGAGMPTDFFAKGGKVADLNEGGIAKVQAFHPPTPPPYMGQLDEMNKADMEDIAGIHRSTMGRSEGAQQSGKHAEILRQQDARRHSIQRQLIETAMSKVAQQTLWLLWEFVSQQRTTAIPGENHGHEVMIWKGEDLSPGRLPFGPHSFNVQASLAPERDPQTVTQLIQGLTQSGYLSPEREGDRLLVMRMLGEQVPNDLDPSQVHRMNAAEENERLRDGKGAEVVAAIGDDDAVHIEAHYRFTTTAAFRTAVRGSQLVGYNMEVHIREHQRQMADKEFRPQAIAKAIQAGLVREYGLMPAAAGAGPGGPAPPRPGGATPAAPGRQPARATPVGN